MAESDDVAREGKGNDLPPAIWEYLIGAGDALHDLEEFRGAVAFMEDGRERRKRSNAVPVDSAAHPGHLAHIGSCFTEEEHDLGSVPSI
jgi:hypothetical protein